MLTEAPSLSESVFLELHSGVKSSNSCKNTFKDIRSWTNISSYNLIFMDMWKSRFIIKWHNYHSNQDIFEGEESEDSWDNSKPSKESLDILAFLSTRGIRSCESRNENGASYMNNSKKLAERVTGRNPHSRFPSSNLQITLSGAQPSCTHMHA